MNIEKNYGFEVQYGRKTYNCSRTVIGGRYYEQFISVQGMNTKKDTMIYRGRFIEAQEKMAAVARIIAHEIIEEYLRKKDER